MACSICPSRRRLPKPRTSPVRGRGWTRCSAEHCMPPAASRLPTSMHPWKPSGLPGSMMRRQLSLTCAAAMCCAPRCSMTYGRRERLAGNGCLTRGAWMPRCGPHAPRLISRRPATRRRAPRQVWSMKASSRCLLMSFPKRRLKRAGITRHACCGRNWWPVSVVMARCRHCSSVSPARMLSMPCVRSSFAIWRRTSILAWPPGRTRHAGGASTPPGGKAPAVTLVGNSTS